MSALVDAILAAHVALNACGLGAEAEEILEHGLAAVDRAEFAVHELVATRLTGARTIAEHRALEALADLAACEEPEDSERPTVPPFIETLEPAAVSEVCS